MTKDPLFRDSGASLEARVADLLSRLGLAEFRAGTEALHGAAWLGAATVFPQAIGLAGTWNPRWGRNEEGCSEDLLLTSVMGTAYASGLRGDHPIYLKSAPTLKHFLGYNNETDRCTTSSGSTSPGSASRGQRLRAAEADVAVVVVGNDPHVNGRETQDRTGLELPPAQAELVELVRRVSPAGGAHRREGHRVPPAGRSRYRPTRGHRDDRARRRTRTPGGRSPCR